MLAAQRSEDRQAPGGEAVGRAGELSASLSRLIQTSNGEPLPESTRSWFESRLDADLGSVRVHTGADAAASASALSAGAYTVGGDIVFGAGRWAPDTKSGRRTLAHELAHVVQDRRGATPSPGMSAPTDASEREAERAADQLTGPGVAGASVRPGASPIATVQRQQAPGRGASPPPPAGGQRDPSAAPDPAKVERDQQIAAFLNANPGWTGVTGLFTTRGFVEEAGGLKALERDYPATYPIIRTRMAAVLGEQTVAGLYRDDEAIMRLVQSSDLIVRRVKELEQRYLAQNRQAAYDWLAEVLSQYELSYVDAATLYKQYGNVFLNSYRLLLEDPEVQIEQLRQLAEDRQTEYGQRVYAGMEPVGSTISELDVFMWFNQEVKLDELMAPQEGVDSYREALVWATLSETACAVMEVHGRCYLYRLNHQYSLDDVLATGFPRRSELLARGTFRGITVVTTDGTTLSAKEGRYFVDQTERPEENLAAEQDVLAAQGSSLSFTTGFRLFRQMVRDLVLANLARARDDLTRERGRFFEGPPSFFTLRPQAGEELQRDAAEFRRRAARAASLAETVGDHPEEAELAALEEALSAVGEIHERNPTAALMVVNLRNKNESTMDDFLAAMKTGEASTGFRDRVAGMLPGDAATAGAVELARRLDNVERVENHVLRHPDAVLDMEPLHEQILEQFPHDQRFMIGLQLSLHGLEQLAEALGMAVVDLVLTITAFAVGGPLGLVIGAVPTAHGISQTMEAFQNVDLLEAMTALDVYGDFALATPEMVSSARKWAWIGAGLTLLDVGGFVGEARHVARLQAVLASPDLSRVLKAARADFGDAARALGKTERQLARELSLVRGAERELLISRLREALEGRQLSRWEDSLSQDTRKLLQADSTLRTTFTKMSARLRRILTHCSDICIPPGLTDVQRVQIENFLMRAERMTGKGGTRFGDAHEWLLREHFYANRNAIDEAIRTIERVSNLNQLEATLRQAASERAIAMRAEAYARAGEAAPALPAEPAGPVYKGTRETHGAQLPAAENWQRATVPRGRGPGRAELVPQGQFYDNRFIPEAYQRATPANRINVIGGGRTVHEFDMPSPVGRVFMPEGRVISDVRRVRVFLEPNGEFFNAYPIPLPGQ